MKIGWTWSDMAKNCQNASKWLTLFLEDIVKFPLYNSIHNTEGPVKLLLSARLSIFRSVSGTFFLRAFNWFFFYLWSYIIVWCKKWKSFIFTEKSILLIFGEKKPQNWVFCIFVLENLAFKQSRKKIIVLLDLSFQIPRWYCSRHWRTV